MTKKQTKDFQASMKAAGLGKGAKAQNDFWARMGVTGIRVGSTTLKIEKPKRTMKGK